jgi:putative IMPACT (imprinted ancient) family translation regulator
LALACCDVVVRYFGGQQIGARIFFKGKVSSRHMNIAQALQKRAALPFLMQLRHLVKKSTCNLQLLNQRSVLRQLIFSL